MQCLVPATLPVADRPRDTLPVRAREAAAAKYHNKALSKKPFGPISALDACFKSSKYDSVFLRFETRGRLDLEPKSILESALGNALKKAS
jgi:hypothetical protein